MGEAPRGDAELLRRARGGEIEAFGQLVEQYQDYVFNVVYHLVGGDRGEAEDIAQEVFIRAYRHLDGFEGRARFSTWLYGIALNCVRTLWRRRRRRGSVSMDSLRENDGGWPDPQADQDGPEESALRNERVSAVRSAIAGLDDDLREVIVLRDIQGLAYEEIAGSLDVALGTVKSRIHRARAALKEVLGPFFSRM